MGNGRLGRILVPLFLFERKLLDRPVFYLSAYFEEHKDAYTSELGMLSSGHPEAWNRWVDFFLKAITQQARKNSGKARSIIGLYERSKAEIIRITRSQYAIPLLDLLFQQPVFSPTQLDRHGNLPSKQMRMSMIGKLREAGILVLLREASGRRPQILAFAGLVNLVRGPRSIPTPKTVAAGRARLIFAKWRKLVGVEPTRGTMCPTLVLKTRPGTGQD